MRRRSCGSWCSAYDRQAGVATEREGQLQAARALHHERPREEAGRPGATRQPAQSRLPQASSARRTICSICAAPAAGWARCGSPIASQPRSPTPSPRSRPCKALNVRAKGDKTYHLVVSFPPGEHPTADQLRDIEDELCAAIGLADHQRISAVHTDTDHLHIHVAISKIHPDHPPLHRALLRQAQADGGV